MTPSKIFYRFKSLFKYNKKPAYSTAIIYMVVAFILLLSIFLGRHTKIVNAQNSTWRVAWSADGNENDVDDWHASPMALAILAHAGFKDRLVHFDYNNILGWNNPDWAKKHEEAVLGAQSRYGYNRAVFYNDQNNLNGAINSISNAVNNSTSSNRLYLICAGPMEVCWQGINQAQDSKEQYVTVISHSTWNDTCTKSSGSCKQASGLSHSLTDIERDFDVKITKIRDQNKTAFFSSPSSWSWLKEIKPNGQWLYEAITIDGKAQYGPPGDASDAGMMWYHVINHDNPTMSQIEAFFKNNPLSSSATPTPTHILIPSVVCLGSCPTAAPKPTAQIPRQKNSQPQTHSPTTIKKSGTNATQTPTRESGNPNESIFDSFLNLLTRLIQAILNFITTLFK